MTNQTANETVVAIAPAAAKTLKTPKPARTSKTAAPKPAKTSKIAKPAPKAAAAPKAAKTPAKAAKPLSARAAILAAAQAGKLPLAPDFSAKTHRRYRAKLDALVALARAGDAEGLKAVEIKTYSSSPQAMDRYRRLCVIAIEARGAKAKAA
jgi:hypothetical protein